MHLLVSMVYGPSLFCAVTASRVAVGLSHLIVAVA